MRGWVLVSSLLAACASPAPEPEPTTEPAPVTTTDDGLIFRPDADFPRPHPVRPFAGCAQLQVAMEITGGADEQVDVLAALPGGDVVVVGRFYGSIELGGLTLVVPAAGSSSFVARLRPDGTAVWGWPIHLNMGFIHAVAVAPTGEIAIAAREESPAVLDDWSLPETREMDGLVLLLEGDGSVRWVRTVSGLTGEYATSVAFDAAGDVWVSGEYGASYAPSTVFGVGASNAVELPSLTDTNDRDAWVMQLSPAGEVLGVVTLNAAVLEDATVVGQRGEGVDVALSVHGPLRLPDGTLTESLEGEQLVSLDAGDMHLRSKAFRSENAVAFGISGETSRTFPTSIMPPISFQSFDGVEHPYTPDVENHRFSAIIQRTETSAEALVLGYSGEIYGWTPSQAAFGPNGTVFRGGSDLPITVFPAGESIHVDFAEKEPRSLAVALHPDDSYWCTVSVVDTKESIYSIWKMTIDESGGLWLGGRFNDELVFHSPDGSPDVTMTATEQEETQGFLVRYQLVAPEWEEDPPPWP